MIRLGGIPATMPRGMTCFSLAGPRVGSQQFAVGKSGLLEDMDTKPRKKTDQGMTHSVNRRWARRFWSRSQPIRSGTSQNVLCSFGELISQMPNRASMDKNALDNVAFHRYSHLGL
jgi:hypothetical protein